MKLLVFGFGYTASACCELLRPQCTKIAVTVRSIEKRDALRGNGYDAFCFDGINGEPELTDRISNVDVILVSTPPDEDGDPVFKFFHEELASALNLKTVIYLSTVGVYGNFDGAWIDETTPPKAQSGRAKRRLLAENAWLDFGARREVNTHVLRLAGIYGPGRNALCDFENGTARRLFKPGQVFNRIHVHDIARLVQACLHHEGQHIFNGSDDEPCPPQDVVAYAAKLLNVEAPPLIDYESAVLSQMARAFYSENKRVSNRALHEKLRLKLLYPTYRQGLDALYAAGEGRNGAPSLRQKDIGRKP